MPDCRFGRDCYRKDCKFAHKDGKKEQGEKQKQRGDKRGREKDSARKFDNKTGDKMCKLRDVKLRRMDGDSAIRATERALKTVERSRCRMDYKDFEVQR